MTSNGQPEFSRHLYDDLRQHLRGHDQDRAIELIFQLLSSGRPLGEVVAEVVGPSAADQGGAIVASTEVPPNSRPIPNGLAGEGARLIGISLVCALAIAAAGGFAFYELAPTATMLGESHAGGPEQAAMVAVAGPGSAEPAAVAIGPREDPAVAANVLPDDVSPPAAPGALSAAGTANPAQTTGGLPLPGRTEPETVTVAAFVPPPEPAPAAPGPPPAAVAAADATPPVVAQPVDTASGVVPRSDERRLSEIEVMALMSRGDRFFAAGDLTSARLFYRRAADGGDGAAALRLGQTFDPAFLERAHLRGIAGDPEQAFGWYRRAVELGSGEAAILLLGGRSARQ